MNIDIEKIKADREKKDFILAQIENFLKDNFCDDELSKRFEWLKEHITDLELWRECNTTLAEQENKPLIEKIHHEED